MTRRKEIDNFLLELEKFLEKYPIDEDIVNYLFMTIFKAMAHNMKNLETHARTLELPILEKLINRFAISKKTDWKRRTSSYIRKVAYWLNYKKVRDFSYEDIFFKMIFKEWHWVYKPKCTIGNHWKIIPTEFLIPEDWYHDDDIYVYDFSIYSREKPAFVRINKELFKL